MSLDPHQWTKRTFSFYPYNLLFFGFVYSILSSPARLSFSLNKQRISCCSFPQKAKSFTAVLQGCWFNDICFFIKSIWINKGETLSLCSVELNFVLFGFFWESTFQYLYILMLSCRHVMLACLSALVLLYYTSPDSFSWTIEIGLAFLLLNP